MIFFIGWDLTVNFPKYQKFETEKQLKRRPALSRGNFHVRCQLIYYYLAFDMIFPKLKKCQKEPKRW